MAVIFLDVDGVLNTYYSMKADTYVCPQAVYWLNHLEDHQIVYSSTWRLGKNQRELEEMRLKMGITIPLHSDGRTCNRHGEIRGDEINEWLGRHPEVTDYLIIDDDDDFHEEHRERFIKTDAYLGFTPYNLFRAQQILEGEKRPDVPKLLLGEVDELNTYRG